MWLWSTMWLLTQLCVTFLLTIRVYAPIGLIRWSMILTISSIRCEVSKTWLHASFDVFLSITLCTPSRCELFISSLILYIRLMWCEGTLCYVFFEPSFEHILTIYPIWYAIGQWCSEAITVGQWAIRLLGYEAIIGEANMETVIWGRRLNNECCWKSTKFTLHGPWATNSLKASEPSSIIAS